MRRRRARTLPLLWLLVTSGGNHAAAVPVDETVTVHGRRPHFEPAPTPVPNTRFDPPGTVGELHDIDTGTDLGAFGGAYSAAMPAPPINPALRDGNQDTQTHVGLPH